jgi:hypothetical protein
MDRTLEQVALIALYCMKLSDFVRFFLDLGNRIPKRLEGLRKLEEQLGLSGISQDEIRAIQELVWKIESNGSAEPPPF